MNLKVIRNTASNISTIGDFLIDDKPFCFSLELPWAEGANQHGLNCILPGTYPVIIDFSPHHNKLWPHILNVPDRDEIRIDIANFPHEILGCVAVGFGKAVDQITQSTAAWLQMFQVLTTALKVGSVSIEIVNQF
jgi:hypothetical protein